jgi:predicted O-methyltransferase YrrM
MDETRIDVLSRLFGGSTGELKRFVEEAERIRLRDDKEHADASHDMGRTDRITLYAAVRAVKPRIVVETGTAAGASAAYILSALNANGQGELHSIELATDRESVAGLVPERLKERFTLHFGDSLEIMPELGRLTGGYDLFVHDSDHRYRHMTAEYELALSCLSPAGGVICSHDVLASNAWRLFLGRHGLHAAGTVKNLGICRVPE